VRYSLLITYTHVRITRGHPLKLTLPEFRVNARAHAFPVRVITVWNRLPADVVLASLLCYHLTIVSRVLI